MTETSSTTRDTVAMTAPIGMYAVAQHMIDAQLPAPWGIDAPSRCAGEDAVRISLSSLALPAWLASIHVDSETHTPATVPGFVHSSYAGRLPNGVRVLLKAARRVEDQHLRLVTA